MQFIVLPKDICLETKNSDNASPSIVLCTNLKASVASLMCLDSEEISKPYLKVLSADKSFFCWYYSPLPHKTPEQPIAIWYIGQKLWKRTFNQKYNINKSKLYMRIPRCFNLMNTSAVLFILIFCTYIINVIQVLVSCIKLN